jgi:hypothetical protein
MGRGLEVGLHLRPGLADEEFVAGAIGNLAAFRLQRARKESLRWQILRVDTTGGHHYRLIVRHPDRILDVGITKDLGTQLESLSELTVETLRDALVAAQQQGLAPVPLRTIHETEDYWRDEFWNWIGLDGG